MELVNELDAIEGMDDINESNIGSQFTNPNDLDSWRKLLYKYKQKKESLEQIKEVRDNIVKKYDESIAKKEWELEHLKSFMVNQIEASDFNTSSGGKKIDQFPDLGTFSVSRKTPKFEVKNEQTYIEMGFARIKPEVVELDKKALNLFLSTCDITPEGTVVDTMSGEIMEDLIVKYDSRVSFKDAK